MIGNVDTFTESRKGKETWIPLMEKLKTEGHVYDGFPIMCAQHPDKTAVLRTKADFDTICPDGGCSEPCGIMLNCGQHICPRRCHQLQDHSKMECMVIISTKCSQNHPITRRCYDIAAAICKKCEAEAREKERKRQRDYKLDQERQAKQAEYARKLGEMKDEMELQKRLMKDHAEEQDRQNALSQQKQDLASLKKKADQMLKAANNQPTQASIPTTVTSDSGNLLPKTSGQSTPAPNVTQNGSGDDFSTNADNDDNAAEQWEVSESKEDWEWQKKFEGAENTALDELMEMIGQSIWIRCSRASLILS